MNINTISAPAAPAAPIAPSMYLSVILSDRPANHRPGWISILKPEPVVALPRFFFLASPGSRLISIIFCASPGSVLSEREADRKHQQRRNFVGNQRFEGVFTHRHRGKRVGELHGLSQSLTERLCKAWSPGSATAGVDRLHLAITFERGRKERDRALQTRRNFFSARGNHGIELRRPVVAPNQSFGVGRRQAVLALQISTEATSSHR